MKLLISKCHFQLSLTLVVFGLFVLVANTDMIIVKAQQEQQPQEQQPHIFKIQQVTRLGDNNKNKKYINKKKQQTQTLQQFFDNLQMADSHNMNNHQQIFGNKNLKKLNNVYVNDKICIQCEKSRNIHRSLKHNSTANKKTTTTTAKTTTSSSSTALAKSTDTTDSNAVVSVDPRECISDTLEFIRYVLLIPVFTFVLPVALIAGIIPCILQGGATCTALQNLLFVTILAVIGTIFLPFLLIEGLLRCGKAPVVAVLIILISYVIISLLRGEIPDFAPRSVMGAIDVTDLTALLAELKQGGVNGRQRQRQQRRHRLLPELDNAEETLLLFNHIDTIFEKVTTSTMEFLVNDITSSQHSGDDGNDTADYQYHNIGERFLQQQQQSLFSTSTLMNLTTSLRNIPQTLLSNEIIQDLLESALMSMTNQTTTTTTTSASNVIAIPFNKTELSSMIIKAMNDLPHDPNGIDALLDFNFDDKTMIQLRTFSSSLLSDPTILDDFHRRISTEEEDAEDEEKQDECSIEQHMLCMTRSLFDNINLIPVLKKNKQNKQIQSPFKTTTTDISMTSKGRKTTKQHVMLY